MSLSKGLEAEHTMDKIPMTAGGFQALTEELRHRQQVERQRIIQIKQQAESQKVALQTVGRFVIKKQVGEDQAIFGTVTNGDVAEAILAATQQEIDRRDIVVPDIHILGFYKAQIKLHPEVSAEVEIHVASL